MKTLLLLFVAALSLFADPDVTVSTLPNTADYSLGWGTAQFHFTVSETYNDWRIEYNSTGASCLGSNGGTGGHVQAAPTSPHVAFFPDNTGILGGLAGNTTYKVCIKVNTSGNLTFRGTSEVTITTLPQPALTPEPPKAPRTFDPTYPDTGTSLTTCNGSGTNNSSTGYCILVPSSCSDIQNQMDNAMWGQSATQGFVIMVPHGWSCTASASTPWQWRQYSNDIVVFHSADVTTGSPGKITVSSGAFTEGQMITYGRHYGGDDIDPGSFGCLDGGLRAGGQYYAHLFDSTHLELACPDRDGQPSTNYMSFTTTGTTPHGLELVPWVSATGTCPTEIGMKACSYWKRNLKKIVIRSDAPDIMLPPINSRMDPTYCAAGQCATLVDPLANIGNQSSDHALIAGGQNDGNAQTMAGAIHIGPGIELTMENDPSGSPGTFANLVWTGLFNGDYVFDRVYFHGLGGNQKWGGRTLSSANFDGSYIALINCYIGNLVSGNPTNDQEGASIIFPDGPGPNMIWNNYIEGVGVPIHFSAGSGGGIRGDDTVGRNTFKAWKKWMYGSAEDTLGLHYLMRQPLEWKSGRRILVVGNTIDTSWAEVTPSNQGITFTSTGEGGNEGYGTTDIDMRSNIFKHVPGVSNFPASAIGGNRQTIAPNRVRFRNNIAWHVGDPALWVPGTVGAPTGTFFQGPTGSSDIEADHNTIVANSGRSATISTISTLAASGVKITNNFVSFGADNHGVASEGTNGADFCCGGLTNGEAFANGMLPGNVITHNVFGSSDASQAQINLWWPSELNTVPSNPADYSGVKWAKFGIGDDADYHLLGSSPYLGVAGDKKNIGADVPLTIRAVGKVGYGGIKSKTTTGATVVFRAPDSYGCPVDLLLHAWPILSTDTASIKRIPDTNTNIGVRHLAITTLTTHTTYYGKIQCQVEQPTFSFTTN